MPSNRLAKRELLVYLSVLALIAFWPSPVDAPATGLIVKILRKLHSWGAPSWINYGLAESAANVLLFVPLGVLLVWYLGRTHWWVGAPAAFIASGAIELGQFLFLPARFPSFFDVVANTAGAVLGSALAYVRSTKGSARPGQAAADGRTTAPGLS